jgi:hypothetical protein
MTPHRTDITGVIDGLEARIQTAAAAAARAHNPTRPVMNPFGRHSGR